MSNSLAEIAEKLRNNNKKFQLIYAFNGVGKTRLSRAFKEHVAPKAESGDEKARAKILYYNAFTEDLFYWDNDLNDDTERKLRIQPNDYTTWILQDEGQDRNAIAHFQRYTNEKLTPRFNLEYNKELDGRTVRIPAFCEVSFSLERGNDRIVEHIKISKGEESNFIWSIFYALLEQVIATLNVAEPSNRTTDQFNQLEYIFIDDPVSSLDENHLIQLAVDLAESIRSSKSPDLKFIISTHSAIFYNVLYSELQLDNGWVLSRGEDGLFELMSKSGHSNTSFSYHLHIKRLIERAIEDKSIQRYHFNLLRNLYEKAASFLGYRTWTDLLPDEKSSYAKRIMHFYSHRSLSHEEVAEPTEPEKQMVKFLLEHLTTQHKFWQHEGTHG